MANTLTSIQTALMYVQENVLKDLKPKSSIIYDSAPMKPGDMLGRKHLSPVVLSYELGFTFGDGDAFAYNDDVAGVYEEIEIDCNPVVLKSRLSVEAADRMAHSSKSALSHVALRAGQMKLSLLKMAEIEMLHGRSASGLGVISGNPSVNTSPNPDQATVIFTAASWAPGIWSGMEGVKLDCYNGASKINAEGDLTLVSVDFDAKSIIVSGTNQDLTDLADGYTIIFKGSYGKGQYGIKYQLDTSGSVFGIDNSVYALRKAVEHDVASGNLVMAEILKGRGKAVARAGLDEDAVLYVSIATFENLNSDMSLARVLDSSYKPAKGENGHKGLVFHGQAGSVEVIAHPMMMEGDAFLIPKKGLRRIGSVDITFGDLEDGKDGGWKKLESANGYQLVCRYSFQVEVIEPGKCVYYKSIVNS